MNEPVSAPNRARPPARPPRISLPVAIIGFAGAVALALVLVALMLASDPGRGTADALGDPPGSAASPEATALPSPTDLATGSPVPSPRPSRGGVHPSPSPSKPPRPAVTFPIKAQADGVLLAPGPDGGLYVLVPNERGAVVALLSVDGRVRPGWPQRLPSPWCSQLLVAGDGSMRAVCEVLFAEEGTQAPVERVYAIRDDGRAPAGWPIDLESGTTATIEGRNVNVIVRPYGGDVLPDGELEPALFAVIDPQGNVRQATDGVDVPCCESTLTAGPEFGYLTTRRGSDDQFGKTDVTAFGIDGQAWQATIDGWASDPTFDSHGHAYFAVWPGGGRPSGTIVLDGSGQMLPSSSAELGIEQTNGWSGAGNEYPMPPAVDGDGRAFLLEASGGSLVLGLDPSGGPMAGWPWTSPADPAQHGACGREDTGCGTSTVPLVADATGRLYVALSPSSASRGGSLVALARNGRLIDGWPVGLKGPGSEFWAMTAASDGGLWALAAEPERSGYSGTLLSIAPDSTIRGKLTLVEP
jgi:hypothetical protein